MMLIVPTFLSFSGYCLKDANCWDSNFSLNLFWRNILWQFYPWRYFIFSSSRDLVWPGGQRNMWFHGCIHHTISLAKEDKLRFYFVPWTHITTLSEDHVTTRWVSLTISPLPPISGGHRPCGRGDIKFSVCHVTSSDHVMRGSSDIMGEFPSS